MSFAVFSQTLRMLQSEGSLENPHPPTPLPPLTGGETEAQQGAMTDATETESRPPGPRSLSTTPPALPVQGYRDSCQESVRNAFLPWLALGDPASAASPRTLQWGQLERAWGGTASK